MEVGGGLEKERKAEGNYNFNVIEIARE